MNSKLETVKLLAWYKRHAPVMRAYVKGARLEIRAHDKAPWTPIEVPGWIAFREYRVARKTNRRAV